MVCLKVEAVKGKKVSLEWTETSRGLWEWWHDPGVPLVFPVEMPALEMRRERQQFFPDHAGKDHSSRARRRKRDSSVCGRDSRASSRVEMGMSGNFLSCSKRVRTLWKIQRLAVISLEMPQRKWASSPWRGEPPGFSRVAAGALDLRPEPQGPALVASGKASPHACCSAASQDSSPVDAGG